MGPSNSQDSIAQPPAPPGTGLPGGLPQLLRGIPRLAVLVFGLAAAPAFPDQVQVRVASGNDDGFLIGNGAIPELGSSDLPLGRGSGPGPPFRTVLLRFDGVDIPPGANILGAQLYLQSASAEGGRTNLVIGGEATPDAAPYSPGQNALTGRPLTSATVDWDDLPAWNLGPQSSPDLSRIVSEIVALPGWQSGNALALRIAPGNPCPSACGRLAMAFDSDPAAAAVLAVEFEAPAEPRLVGEWRFDEAAWSGVPGEVVDSSGNGLNGTASGSADSGDGQVCNGADLSASSARITIGAGEPTASGPLDLAHTQTLMAWLRLDDRPRSFSPMSSWTKERSSGL